jgi:hypothetical protein
VRLKLDKPRFLEYPHTCEWLQALPPSATTALARLEDDVAEPLPSAAAESEVGFTKPRKLKEKGAHQRAGGPRAAERLKRMAALQLEGARLTSALGLA